VRRPLARAPSPSPPTPRALDRSLLRPGCLPSRLV
jgi:hypothetical protein